MSIELTPEMNAVLEKAAASSDPAVRAMAIEYRKMVAKMDGMDLFFDMYRTAQADTGSVQQVSKSTRAKQPVVVQSRQGTRGRRGGTDEFMDRVNAVLATVSAPMQLGELYDAYFNGTPENERQDKTAFRVRLFKRRSSDKIQFRDKEGYWPVNRPWPNGVDHVAA